jgi:putative ABC transport system permease protein
MQALSTHESPKLAKGSLFTLLKLSFRLFFRELGRGELTIIALSLILAVSSVMTLSSVTDRVEKAIMSKGAEFLAADLELSSAHEIQPEVKQQAISAGLKIDDHIYFTSMAFANDNLNIAAVKAVSPTYPLKGDLLISRSTDLASAELKSAPSKGNVWMSKRLFFALGLDEQSLQAGEPLPIEIGDSQLNVAGLIAAEPDAPFQIFDSGTRLIMNIEDVPATNVIQPGSRIWYVQLYAGEEESLSTFRGWLDENLKPNQRVADIKDGNDGVSSALKRAESFLMLAGVLGVLLAAVAVSVAAKLFSQRHLDSIAIFKTLGASVKQVRVVYLMQLLFITLFSIAIGIGLGAFLQTLAINAMADYLPPNLPEIGSKPILMATFTGFACALMFSVPSLLALFSVPAMRVLRRNLGDNFNVSWFARVLMAVTTIALVYMYSLNWNLTSIIIGAGSVLVVLIVITASVMFTWSRKVGSSVGGSALKIALASLKRRSKENTSQLIGFTLAIMLVLVLYSLENTIIQEWQRQLPEGTPNHFVVNIADHELEEVEKVFAEKGIVPEQYYPIIRGRLTRINDEEVKQGDRETGAKLKRNQEENKSEEDKKEEEAKKESEGRVGIGRELNLTYTEQLPSNNEVIDGNWMTEGMANQVSIEQEVAERLDVKLDDRLTFLIGAREVEVTITSIRTVDWNSFQPNFFMIFSNDVLADFPATHITSFYLPKEDKLWVNTLLRQFPTLSVIDVEAMIEEVQEVIEQVSVSIRFVLLVVVLAATLVLLAQVQSSLDERRKETVIYRTLGAKGSMIKNAISLEFLALGAIAGVIAAAVAEFSLFLLQWRLFDMDWQPHYALWLIGPISGATFVAVVGVLSTRGLLNMTPNQLIRQLS